MIKYEPVYGKKADVKIFRQKSQEPGPVKHVDPNELDKKNGKTAPVQSGSAPKIIKDIMSRMLDLMEEMENAESCLRTDSLWQAGQLTASLQDCW